MGPESEFIHITRGDDFANVDKNSEIFTLAA